MAAQPRGVPFKREFQPLLDTEKIGRVANKPTPNFHVPSIQDPLSRGQCLVPWYLECTIKPSISDNTKPCR